MGLRAKKPEIRPAKRAKILLSGEAGVGKTYFSLQFPNCYFIDAEGGAEREQYQELLIKSKGMYVGKEEGIADFNEVIKEIKSLATEKHDYKTVVIDSLSQIYNQHAAEHEAKHGSDYGADKKAANIPSRELLRWIDKIDMNVVLICHAKADWKIKDSQGNVGSTFDAFEKTSYHLDLWLEIKGRNIVTRKSRIDSFKDGHVFTREYKAFADLFGASIIDREVETMVLATESEVRAAQSLTKGLNYSAVQVDKLFKKADVERWEDMTHQQILSCIKFMENQIDSIGAK
jgi:hypothetical protein